MDDAFTQTLRMMAEWAKADPEEVQVEFNKELIETRLSGQELNALVAAWQQEAFSEDVLWANLQRGKIARRAPRRRAEPREVPPLRPRAAGAPPPRQPTLPPVSCPGCAAMPTVNEELCNRTVAHPIGVERYATGALARLLYGAAGARVGSHSQTDAGGGGPARSSVA
ncbi:MAG: hypothetical protein JXQ29_05130, partial [Planctomycetes bacterium]|nr:hypothetical protein [Planctomycetota bacterium]